MAKLLALCALRACAALGTANPGWSCDTPLNGFGSVNGTVQLHSHWLEEQQTEAATPESLDAYLKERKQNLLLVFYAPWCGHCQGFVMRDESGDPKKAPIELLNKVLLASKGPKVLKYDIDNGKPIQFAVQHVPTIYRWTTTGETSAYIGDSNDIAALAYFGMQGSMPVPGSMYVVPGAVAFHSKPALRTSMRSLSSWGRMTNGDCDLPAAQPVQLHSIQQQKVEAATSSTLQAQLQSASRDLLVVFYAPWCGHCRQFVSEDANGVPEKAPLELLNKDLLGAKGPKVMKYDCQANAWPEQSQFRTEYVPSIYLAKKNGQKTLYGGDALDLAALKAFALQSAK